jgi:hypothetical protein
MRGDDEIMDNYRVGELLIQAARGAIAQEE